MHTFYRAALLFLSLNNNSLTNITPFRRYYPQKKTSPRTCSRCQCSSKFQAQYRPAGMSYFAGIKLKSEGIAWIPLEWCSNNGSRKTSSCYKICWVGRSTTACSYCKINISEQQFSKETQKFQFHRRYSGRMKSKLRLDRGLPATEWRTITQER